MVKLPAPGNDLQVKMLVTGAAAMATVAAVVMEVLYWLVEGPVGVVPSPRYLLLTSKLQTGLCWGGAGSGPPFTTSPISTCLFPMMNSDLFRDSDISGSW